MRECMQANEKITVALVGNPNVGKSTLFNVLTGGKQHTGNWAGKTVSVARGEYTYKGKDYALIDLPGTYALMSQSEEERIAADFIQENRADCTVIISDATCLERNLCFALQVMELTDRVILCVNLMDEAESRGLVLDFEKLHKQLGIPVIGISAGKRVGLDALKESVRNMCDGFVRAAPLRLDATYEDSCDIRVYSRQAEQIVKTCVKGRKAPQKHRFDSIALGRWSGKLILLGLLFAVFWMTVVGANYPSRLLQYLFDAGGSFLRKILSSLPQWVSGLLVDGIYITTARVVSVMLPPMLIFFPVFSLLEDLGYLPRAAFLMDHTFERCGSCGKQVLTMSMGFGCNAVGVMGCRIISSPRERLLSILTNSLVPCNGRFPALIALAYYIYADKPVLAAVCMTGMVLLSVFVTFIATKFLSKTALRGEPSHFIMEMPPYRKPNLKKILIGAWKERTLFVLSRAVMVAAPTGAILWLMSRIEIYDRALLSVIADFLNPVGMALGMSGVILLAFILSFPANELFLPLAVMMFDGAALAQAETAVLSGLAASGWTNVMALCTMVFVLFHWPCSTTCFTIYKETGSKKWTLLAILLPTAIGVLLCAAIKFVIL